MTRNAEHPLVRKLMVQVKEWVNKDAGNKMAIRIKRKSAQPGKNELKNPTGLSLGISLE
jgi:hypothetical protein